MATNEMTVANFDEALENGPYAFPGGYPLFFICADGEALAFEEAKKEAHLIRAAIEHGGVREWRVVGIDINWEDEHLFCAHSNVRIPSAYED